MSQPVMTAPARRPILLVAALAWSSLGSTLTAFALDVWLFQTTGSYRMFALVAILSSLAGIMFAPFAGVLADRLSKRLLLLVCDLVCLLGIAAVAIVHSKGRLGAAGVVAISILLALCQTLRLPTLGAAVSALTPKELLPRVNGASEACQGAVALGGAMLGAALLNAFGLSTVLFIDVMTYLVCALAVSLLLWKTPAARAGQQRLSSALLPDLAFGIRWIARNRGVRRLLIFFSFSNMGFVVFATATAPLVLTRGSATTLAIYLTCNALGMILGGSLLERLSRAFRSENIVTWSVTICALCMMLIGLWPDGIALYALGFLFWMCVSIANGCAQTIWQIQVPLECQGRVFSVRKMVGWILAPIALLVSLPVAEWMPELLASSDKTERSTQVLQHDPLAALVLAFGGFVLMVAISLQLRGGLRFTAAHTSDAPA
jgi:MFS family permease